MKNYLRTIAALTLALAVGVGGVDAATDTRKINTAACETVYTNYYFFLDANTTDFFNQKRLSDISHDNIAVYHNNSYQIDNFDTSNIGYGQVKITRTSTTSKDGITSMSLDDYYDHYLYSTTLNGAYSSGTKNYIVAHDWFRVNTDESVEEGGLGLNLSTYTKKTLIAATLDAESSFTRQSAISPSAPNPFRIRIDRDYYGYLTGTPLTYGSYKWYIHPAVYYVQYCSPAMEDDYTITYDGNSYDAYNVPNSQTEIDGRCINISSQTPYRNGYTFLGWSKSSTAAVPDYDYTPGSRYCGERGDLRLYAVWKKNVVETPVETYYTVYYRSNTNDSVSNMPNDTTTNSKSDVYISSAIPVRSGYTFLGWSTDASATVANSSYNSGTLYTDRKDIVLYAIWKLNTPSTPSDPTLPENPQTAVTDYLLPFGGVISASGAGLGLLKKKKTFKQF